MQKNSNEIQNDLKITSRFNNGDYLTKNIDWHVEDSPWKAKQINKIISRNTLMPETICEIGCGAGEILRQLSMMKDYGNTSFIGYEISDDAFELCRTRIAQDLKFLKEDLLEADQYFDVVLCIDVFEHVENYFGFLRKLRHKGEYKIFHIPLDLSVSSLVRGRIMYARNSVGHLNYFTPDTAIATLEECGYHVLDTMFTPIFLDLPSKSWSAKLVKIPRTLLYKLSPELLAKYLGGISLMVLAK